MASCLVLLVSKELSGDGSGKGCGVRGSMSVVELETLSSLPDVSQGVVVCVGASLDETDFGDSFLGHGSFGGGF